MGTLYVLRAGARDLYKVGITRSSISTRKRNLQTGSADSLKLVTEHHLPKDHLTSCERFVHAGLSPLRSVSGGKEFFRSEDSLAEPVKALVDEYMGLVNEKSTLPDLLERRRIVDGQFRAASIKKSLLEASIVEGLGDTESFSVDGDKLVSVHSFEQKYFDLNAFREAHPETYTQFLQNRKVRKIQYA